MSQNKLEEYKIKEANKFYDVREEAIGLGSEAFNGYVRGFDTAIALDLPVKFAEWKDKYWTEYEDYPGQYHPSLKVGKPKTLKELYQYWIQNVYKPE